LFIRPATYLLLMEMNNENDRRYAVYLSQLLDRVASPEELNEFIRNQDLMKITKREPRNASFQVTAAHVVGRQPAVSKVFTGEVLQLHSHEREHRFYTVFLAGTDSEEERYLILDAFVEVALVEGSYTELVQAVRLITIQELVQAYSPVMYNLV